MTYRGHIENGVVVLDEQCDIPDGMRVTVDPIDAATGNGSRSLPEGLLRLAGILTDMPREMSENHDHHLYGCPKK